MINRNEKLEIIDEYTFCVQREENYNYICEFMIGLDNEILNDYNMNCNIVSYNNDLELYIEIAETLIDIFEEKEEYEKCQLLKCKIDESKIILEKNTI